MSYAGLNYRVHPTVFKNAHGRRSPGKTCDCIKTKLTIDVISSHVIRAHFFDSAVNAA